MEPPPRAATLFPRLLLIFERKTMRKILALVTFALVSLTACLDVKSSYPPPPGGYRGVVCGHELSRVIYCNEYEVCGGGPFSGCPQGMCCYVGPQGHIAPPQFVRDPHRQYVGQ
jgi:hypothetical protein